jgi:hypothetical protein
MVKRIMRLLFHCSEATLNRYQLRSFSRIRYKGYRPKWHIKTGVATTPLSARPLWPSPWPTLLCRCGSVAARLTLQDARCATSPLQTLQQQAGNRGLSPISTNINQICFVRLLIDEGFL